MINIIDNIIIKNNIYFYFKLDCILVIIFVFVISVLVVVFNLILLFVIFFWKQFCFNVFLWNVVGMCVFNLFFGIIINVFGDSCFIYKEWFYGIIFCKVFFVFDLILMYIMSMIQIIIVISFFLKVKLFFLLFFDIILCIWIIFFYILFFLFWFGEVVLILVVILGEMNDLLDYVKKYGLLMCFYFFEKNI